MLIRTANNFEMINRKRSDIKIWNLAGFEILILIKVAVKNKTPTTFYLNEGCSDITCRTTADLSPSTLVLHTLHSKFRSLWSNL